MSPLPNQMGHRRSSGGQSSDEGGEVPVGFNVLSLNTIPGSGALASPNSPLFLVNVQKGFELGDDFLVGIGTQCGEKTASAPTGVRLADFTWMTLSARLPDEWGRLYAGPYYGIDRCLPKVLPRITWASHETFVGRTRSKAVEAPPERAALFNRRS